MNRKTANQSAYAAYVSGERLTEITRDGEVKVHDFGRRAGVLESWIELPDGAPEWAKDRSQLFTAVGLSEPRKNSVLLREILVETPAELSPAERKRFVQEHARWLAVRYNTAVSVALHKPTRRQDSRHFHAHCLLPCRELTPDGFGRKLRELDLRQGGSKHVHAIREHVAAVTNAAFERSNRPERVDPRSKRRQKLARSKTVTTEERIDWHKKHEQLRAEVREREQDKPKGRGEIQQALAKLQEKAKGKYKGIER